MSLYRYERRSSPALLLIGFFIVGLAIAAVVVYQVRRELPQPPLVVSLAESTVLGAPRMPVLPEGGAGAVSVPELGLLGQRNGDEPRPIASVTKVMTAYVILKEHPLAPGEDGPSVEVTQAHADRFWEMVAQDQSVTALNAGQQLTQLELLRGLMIPSANNYAEILAEWDSGSVEAFVLKMNAEAEALGMTDTVYADVSGFSSGSISTAADQLILARAAMANPVFAETVAMREVTLPGAGTVSNVNQLLGTNGVIGIKTGFTEQAGGNLMFAARQEVSGRSVDVIGIIMGQEDRPAAFDATLEAIDSVSGGLQTLRVVPAGLLVGVVEPQWGGSTEVVVGEDVSMLVWPGSLLETSVELEPIDAGAQRGELAGWLNVRVGAQEQRVPIVLADDLEGAGLVYRLTRF